MLGRTMKGETNIFAYVILATLALVTVGSLINTIANNTVGVSGTGNVTGAGGTLYGLSFLFFVIGLIIAILGMAGLKIKMGSV